MTFKYFILEKKRKCNAPAENPYWIERKLFLDLGEAESAAYSDTDLFRIYSAPATLCGGTEEF